MIDAVRQVGRVDTPAVEMCTFATHRANRRRTGNQWAGLFCLGLLFVVNNGCSPTQPMGQVDGCVRVAGQPAEHILVTFLPDPERGTFGSQAIGVTDAQGRYE